MATIAIASASASASNVVPVHLFLAHQDAGRTILLDRTSDHTQGGAAARIVLHNAFSIEFR
ncbi:hypothetical protein [Mesorhizobium sp. WSM3866]|uniref:hypothetical protein n=1 Tax=Mesorhizobium sp. WSM3866 TaxID=422271 RepID=UPI001596EC1F|nr:hypothetical protein [Mesorhizobium sp. WSM3866]